MINSEWQFVVQRVVCVICTAKSESEKKDLCFSYIFFFLLFVFFLFCEWKWQCVKVAKWSLPKKANIGWPHDVTHRSIPRCRHVGACPFRSLSRDEMTSQSNPPQSPPLLRTATTTATAPRNHPVNLRCVLRGIKTKAFFTIRNLLLFFLFCSVLFSISFCSSLLHVYSDWINSTDLFSLVQFSSNRFATDLFLLSSRPPLFCVECVYSSHPKLPPKATQTEPPTSHPFAHLPSPPAAVTWTGLDRPIGPIDCLKYSVWNRSAMQRSVH